MGPHGHPYLHEPLLYISNVPAYVSDENLAVAFVSCGPFRPNIARDGGSHVVAGTIEFRYMDKAEKALATLQSRRIPGIEPPPPFVHGPGQQVQLAPLHGPGSTSHSGLIDPCNLFCKASTPVLLPSSPSSLPQNLDPSIDSNDLFSHFRQFGQIVSARVMRNESGDSRGFGFVSFQTPVQASTAMHAMNGVQLGSKQIVVRLHEPKQLRQEKLAQRFGHNNHPRSASGATSPAASEAGDSYVAFSSPRRLSAPLSPVSGSERSRRGSGSYFNAALSGTLNLPMRYDDLAGLSPVVRKEVLTGELSRRIKNLHTVSVPDADLSTIVNALANLALSEVVQCIEDPAKLESQVVMLKTSFGPAGSVPSSKSPSASSSSQSPDSRLLGPPASAPEHPSTPVSLSPPRTSSPPSSSSTSMSERERMLSAVNKLENARQAELVDLLMSLPKRERAMCLFNVEVLRVKLGDAKVVLESEEGDEGEHERVPMTPQAKKSSSSSRLDESPKTPDLSSRGPSAASSPLPGTPSGGAGVSAGSTSSSGSTSGSYTLASLARLPASEIIRIASAGGAGAALPKADKTVVQATDEFVDALRDKQVQQQKQMLGDKLYVVVKSFGVKGAPKVTIALLDQEDLRALAHLMNSYPEVLREKAVALSGGK
ncbi:Polyadenylate-binding protein, cytoplasmic and nuclear [Termitomyces sp. J132]|nr:Polyadenylate-binding protein, cytoplasmic and nuclear [Termitomyces sp. J132]